MLKLLFRSRVQSFHIHFVEAIEAAPLGELAPEGDIGPGIRQALGALDEESGFFVDAHTARFENIVGAVQ